MAKGRWFDREILEMVSTEFRDRSVEYYVSSSSSFDPYVDLTSENIFVYVGSMNRAAICAGIRSNDGKREDCETGDDNTQRRPY